MRRLEKWPSLFLWEEHRIRLTGPLDPLQGVAARAFDAERYAWAPLVPELLVTNLKTSQAFWCGLLGFAVGYDRREQGFAYLDRDGAQLMLCEQSGEWETGPLEQPFGRGVNFQVTVLSLAPVEAALAEAGVPLYEGPNERWRLTGDRLSGSRELLVQDPDGYLVRLLEPLGTKPRP